MKLQQQSYGFFDENGALISLTLMLCDDGFSVKCILKIDGMVVIDRMAPQLDCFAMTRLLEQLDDNSASVIVEKMLKLAN